MWVVFAILDRKAGEHGQLYTARTRQVGARMFADMILGGQETIVRLHPEDFQLDELGTFDEETGTLVGYEYARVVIDALEVMRRASANGSAAVLESGNDQEVRFAGKL